MLLHPDGREELLVRAAAMGRSPIRSCRSTASRFIIRTFTICRKHGQGDLGKPGPTFTRFICPLRKITRLTDQTFTPNTRRRKAWTAISARREAGRDAISATACYNMGPCPLPGGRLMFVSNRNGFPPAEASRRHACNFSSWTRTARISMQIGYLNIGMALHPTVLKDGRVVFSSLESQGLRNSISVGLVEHSSRRHAIGPVHQRVRHRRPRRTRFTFKRNSPTARIIAEEYYNLNNSGFGAYFKLPPQPPARLIAPLWARPLSRIRESAISLWPLRQCPAEDLSAAVQPYRLESFTRFANNGEGPGRSIGARATRIRRRSASSRIPPPRPTTIC